MNEEVITAIAKQAFWQILNTPEGEAKLIRAIVKSLGLEKKTEQKTEWVDKDEAARLLGFNSYRRLNYLIEKGAFTHGIHYRDVRAPGAAKAYYQYHVENIEKLFNKPPEKRKQAR